MRVTRRSLFGILAGIALVPARVLGLSKDNIREDRAASLPKGTKNYGEIAENMVREGWREAAPTSGVLRAVEFVAEQDEKRGTTFMKLTALHDRYPDCLTVAHCQIPNDRPISLNDVERLARMVIRAASRTRTAPDAIIEQTSD